MSGWAALGQMGASLLGNRHKHQLDKQSMRRQMSFQDFMSSTAHQREVQDLRRAGLNPILSATGGSGSPMGFGSAIPAASSDLGHSAYQGRILGQTLRNMKADEENTKMDTEYKASQRGLTNLLGNESTVRYFLLHHQKEREKALAEMAHSAAKGAKLEGEIDQTKYGEIMRYVDRAVRSLTGGSSAYRNMFNQR